MQSSSFTSPSDRISQNQYVVLILNLLLADLQQSVSLVISFHWIRKDGILAPTSACFAQGWLLNIGDVSSGLFVFFIALHTYVCAVRGRRIPHKTFVGLILATWALALLLTALGPIMYGQRFFVRAGAWCWIGDDYQRERLAFHYIWVFMVQFSTVIIYALVLLHLRKTMNIIMPAASQSDTYAKVDRAAKLMVVYPFCYIVLTLPLSAGRMWSLAHGGKALPDDYALIAGALITSSGWVDVLLYTFTRKQLIRGSNLSSNPRSRTAEQRKYSGWADASHNGTGSRSNALVSASHEIDSRRQDSLPWSGIPDRSITQTRTITVTGSRAPLETAHESHPAFELVERESNASSVEPDRHSRSSSVEPIFPAYSTGPLAYAQGRTNKKSNTTVNVRPLNICEKSFAGSSESNSLKSHSDE